VAADCSLPCSKVPRCRTWPRCRSASESVGPAEVSVIPTTSEGSGHEAVRDGAGMTCLSTAALFCRGDGGELRGTGAG